VFGFVLLTGLDETHGLLDRLDGRPGDAGGGDEACAACIAFFPENK
jgi:hypothetical protein